MLKYYTIFIDGIDKCGKDLISQYVIKLSNFRYIVNGRGILSQIAYNHLYNRQTEYDLTQQSNFVNVLLDVDENDWKIRCNITNETSIDYLSNKKAFDYAYSVMSMFDYPLFRLNTSDCSPYNTAKTIVKLVDSLNNTNNLT